MLLALAIAVILRSESRGTHDHILLSQIQDSPKLEGQAPVFISPRNTVARLYPRHWVPFSSPPTTRRATVEVSDPASDLKMIFIVLFITPRQGPHKKSSSSIVACNSFRGNVFTQLFHSNGCVRHISFRDNSFIVACRH
jgi:hypothetical protein